MPYWRQAARLPRPSTRTRRRISDHFSMFVNTPVPHSSGPRWSAGRPPSWARVGESDQGCDTFRPPVGYPAGCCPFSPPFRPASAFLHSIDTPIVLTLVRSSYTTILMSDAVVDGEFDLLYFFRIMEEFLR